MTISNSTKVRPLRDKGLGLIITTVHFCRTFATYAYHEVILKVHQFGARKETFYFQAFDQEQEQPKIDCRRY